MVGNLLPLLALISGLFLLVDCDKIQLPSLVINSSTSVFPSVFNEFKTSESPIHAQWRQTITTGIQTLPKIGYPGQAIVFGQNASVIVKGDMITDILIAAGELGSGRVVAITHDGYGENFTTGTHSDSSVRSLHSNIKNWLFRNQSYDSSNIMDAEAYLRIIKLIEYNEVRVLFCSQPVREWSAEEVTMIQDFVKNGGGLLVAATPWGWAQIKNSNNFNLMLTYRTLLEAGIAFTDGYISSSEIFTFNHNTHLSHLAIQVDITFAPENNSFNYSDTVSVLDQAQYLPIDTLVDFQNRIMKLLTPGRILLTAPSQQTPIVSPYDKAKVICYQRFFLNGEFSIPAPKHQQFPGTVNKSHQNFAYVSREFTFFAPNFRQFHHTGLYAVPGQPVKIQVLGSFPNSTWTVSIGFHYDNNIQHQSWVRWPTLYTRHDLTENKNFSCGFGGLIVLQNPEGTNEKITIRVSNAVEAPWYDSQNATSMADWPNRKTAVGAWGCALGKWIGFCMPRLSFENVDPRQILDIYDQIYVLYHILRGTRPENQRKNYIIADIAPVAGYMHSGYPIVTSMDVATPSYSQFQFNKESLMRQGQWGIFHELGHNMQREWWTPQGTVEVTVNIFSLIATQIILHTSPKHAPWLIDQKQSALKYLKNPNFAVWKDNPGIALCIYAQVIEDYGWNSMRNVLALYERGDSSFYPKQEQEIIDHFWSKYSLEVGVDLSKLLIKWGIPFNANFKQLVSVSGLKPYLQKVNLFEL